MVLSVAALSVTFTNAQMSSAFSPNQPTYSTISVSQAERVLVSGLPPSTSAVWGLQPVTNNAPLSVILASSNGLVVSFGQASMNYSFTSAFGSYALALSHLPSHTLQ